MIPGSIGENALEAFYRIIAPDFAHMPRSGAGAARRGGRFNRPGQEALYLSRDESTALAEYKQDNAFLPPGTICTFLVGSIKVADLSAGFDPERWDPLWADFALDWRVELFNNGREPPTWYMADEVMAAGLEGILFPSQAYPGGTNLVIFDSSKKRLDQLDVYDPHGVLKRLRP